MKKLILSAATGLFLASSVLAQTDTNTVSTAPTTPDSTHGAVSPARREQRREMMKAIGLSQADLKGLSPEDRKAKVKAAVDKTIADLQAKKTAGTITSTEQTTLDQLQKFAAHAGPKKPAAPADQ